MILAVAADAAAQTQARMEAMSSFVMHHVLDAPVWRVFPGMDLTLMPSLTIGGKQILSVHGVMVIIVALLLITVFGVFYRRNDAVPTGLTNLLESFVVFIRDEISVRYLGPVDGMRMAPLFCSFFFFIMTANLIGLIPCFAAATSNLSVTGPLAVISLFFMFFGAIYKNGLAAFLKGFVPHGIPKALVPMLFVIEFLGMFIRSGALMIRLFANMIAGHIAIFSMLGLVFVYGVLALPAIVLALGIYLLEVFICLLQAYIFTLFSAIFIGERYHPEH